MEFWETSQVFQFSLSQEFWEIVSLFELYRCMSFLKKAKKKKIDVLDQR